MLHVHHWVVAPLSQRCSCLFLHRWAVHQLQYCRSSGRLRSLLDLTLLQVYQMPCKITTKKINKQIKRPFQFSGTLHIWNLYFRCLFQRTRFGKHKSGVCFSCHSTKQNPWKPQLAMILKQKLAADSHQLPTNSQFWHLDCAAESQFAFQDLISDVYWGCCHEHFEKRIIRMLLKQLNAHVNFTDLCCYEAQIEQVFFLLFPFFLKLWVVLRLFSLI